MDDLETSAAETDLQNEEEGEDLESIRFASYRTASKLRSLQKRTFLHHIDIWNMIEAFRENGLNEVNCESSGGILGEGRLQGLINSLYVNLRKRLPPGPDIRNESDVLRTWILEVSPKVKVRTVKTSLAVLCAGKLMDKLRYVFSQCADGNGHLIHKRFTQFLRDALKLPLSIGEYDSFKSSSNEVIFPDDSRVNVNDFLETMMSDPGPQCLSWLLVLHRIINAESVHHPITCGYCLVRGFNGLRYKSDRANYNLCQNCFWRGKIGNEHKDDVFKEYNSYKSSSGRSSFKKSLQCINNSKTSQGETNSAGGANNLESKIIRQKSKPLVIPHFPEQEIPMQLMPNNNGYATPHSSSRCTTPRNPPTHPSYSSLPRINHSAPLCSSNAGSSFVNSDPALNLVDEHSLIAEYTHQLNDESGRSALLHSRHLVQELERKNQEIIRDISKLRQNSKQAAEFQYHRHQQPHYGGPHPPSARPLLVPQNANPKLIKELYGLRSKKEDLDQRLVELQNARRDLMTELEELMKLLKNQKIVPPNNGLNQSQFHTPQQSQPNFLVPKRFQEQKQSRLSPYLRSTPENVRSNADAYPTSSLASVSD